VKTVKPTVCDVCLFYAIDVKNTKGELFLLRKLQMGLIFNIQSFVHLFNLKISVARKGEKKKKNFHTENTHIGPNRTQFSGPRLMDPWITG